MKGDPVRIEVNPDCAPVAQRHRRIPFYVRSKVREKLKQLEDQDIIEKAIGPTPWISPIVVVPKQNSEDVRICVDMRCLNQAILRERHIIPTLDDVMADLNGCTVFSKVDLKQGYHQLLLDEQSRQLTTFATEDGLWRYKRLNFGLSCAAEIFQDRVSRVLEGMKHTRNISDDIYVGGKDTADHDQRLKNLLQRLQDNGLTINAEKCQFRVPKITFFGHTFSADGISADPAKVDSIRNAEPPETPTEVRSFLSSVSFCSRFIPGYSILSEPLRRLTYKDVPWVWGPTEAEAFNCVKNSILREPLAYFDPMKKTILYVDASPVGLGAVLTQEDKPLYYASRALTVTEQNYSQIEREALAVYWGINRFNLYLYGGEFVVVTDHKPLLPLFNKPNSKPQARIERWVIGLQGYRYELKDATTRQTMGQGLPSL